MKLWLAYVQDLYEEFDPSKHCDERFDEFSFRMSLTLGQAATVDIERRQTGWSLVASGQPRNILVSESMTGDSADAYVRARARIVGLPSDLLGPTQTITAVCAPADLTDRLLAFCKEHMASAPETDFLFADASPGDVESYLLGRSGNLQIDPATHAIRFIDDIDADTVHDMAAFALYEGGRPADGPGLYDPPVKTYRAELSVAWTQTATGETDIRGFFPGGIETLDSGFAGRIATSLSADGAEGWTVGAIRLATTVGETLPVSVGAIYSESEIRTEVLVAFEPGTNPTNDPVPIIGQHAEPPNSQPEDEAEIQPLFRNYRHSIKQFEMSYVYTQPRSERAYIALDMPVQDSVLVRDDEPEPLQLVLGDVFADPGIEEWETDRDYLKGDRVRHGDGYFKAVADHHSTFFDEDRGIRVEEPVYVGGEPVQGLIRFTTTYWMRTIPEDIPTAAAMETFLETPRGQACIQHALLRLRKEARRRLLVRHVTSGYDWRDAAHVDLADGLSLVVSYDGGTTGRRIAGKIVTMEYTWDGEAAVIDVEIAVPFGTGVDTTVPPEDGYADDYADGWAGGTGSAIGQIDHYTSADAIRGYVDAKRLFSPNYSCLNVQVRNQTSTQLTKIDETVAAGADVTEVSVRFPTYATVRMRSLAPQELPERELDVAAVALVSPAGIRLSEGPVPA